MFKKFFLFTGFLLLAAMLFAPAAFAADGRMHELNYFHTDVLEENGRDVLRIEIGMNRTDLAYTVQKNEAKPKQLIVDMQNSLLGSVRPDATLDGSLGRYLTIRETGRHQLRVMVAFASEVEEQNYKVYTLPADRQANKPYRLVIDVMTPAEAPMSKIPFGGAEGVAGQVIVLDPGHGGSDSGAVGPNGVREKDIALQVAQKVRAILEGAGARVVMTRTTDRDVYGPNASAGEELQARSDVANRLPDASVFLSIHCNAFGSPTANGTETYSAPGSYQGRRLAGFLQEELVSAGGLVNRGAKEANLYVLTHTNMPAALVELAFISNYREEELLTSDDFQNKMAHAIAKGLSRFFGSK